MKETEKIEIMHFSQEGYLEDGKNGYETGKKMIERADKVADEGCDAVFLMGVGGTWDGLLYTSGYEESVNALKAKAAECYGMSMCIRDSCWGGVSPSWGL